MGYSELENLSSIHFFKVVFVVHDEPVSLIYLVSQVVRYA